MYTQVAWQAAAHAVIMMCIYNTLTYNWSGLLDQYFLPEVMRGQLNIMNTDEYWRIWEWLEHRWLFKHTKIYKQYWSARKFTSKHSHISAILWPCFLRPIKQSSSSICQWYNIVNMCSCLSPVIGLLWCTRQKIINLLQCCWEQD